MFIFLEGKGKGLEPQSQPNNLLFSFLSKEEELREGRR